MKANEWQSHKALHPYIRAACIKTALGPRQRRNQTRLQTRLQTHLSQNITTIQSLNNKPSVICHVETLKCLHSLSSPSHEFSIISIIYVHHEQEGEGASLMERS